MMRLPLLPLFHVLPPKPTFKLPRPPTICKYSSTTTSLPIPPPPSSAYVHLPFCRKRCHYCDFPIVALGISSPYHPDSDPRISDYIHLLLREIKSTKLGPGPRRPLETVFFGGGTPSLVPPRLISAVLETLFAEFGTADNPEVSIEMDPGTFDVQKLDELVGLGITRVSLGVQAFQQELLKVCGRAHSLEEVEAAIEMVGSCRGLENWSIDLISSLPLQTEAMWDESLRRSVAAASTHVSVYDLQIEKGTKFGQLYTPGEFPLPNETQSANFYKMASETLAKAGYNHYEISSYSKSGYECKHNLAYWQNKSFYGFGLGSASYTNGVRFSRPKRLKEYANFVQMLEDGAIGGHSIACVETKDMAMDVVMLSLRTARGLDLNSFARDFGRCLASSLCEAFRPFVQSGHAVAMDAERRPLSEEYMYMQDDDDDCETGSRVAFMRLSDPEGFLLSNELISVAFGVISP